jgi:cation/acetate symporter
MIERAQPLLRLGDAPARDIALAERALRDLPRTPAEAQAWERARLEALERARPPPRHAEAHPGAHQASRQSRATTSSR